MTSKYKALICSFSILLGLSFPVAAQHVALDPLEMRPSGEAYQQAIRFRGIDTDVVYFDPTRPPPELETEETPPEPQARQTPSQPGTRETSRSRFTLDEDTARLLVIVILSLAIMGIAYLVARYGGLLQASFSREPDNAEAENGNGQAATGETEEPLPASLEAILAMRDRREALVALCRILLARAVAAQGVLFQRSWTDRDALRRVPQTLGHRDALRALVFASEKVQFGGRDVTEEEFNAHVTKLQPLWRAMPS